MPKVEIISAKPRITKEEQVVVDVEAAFYREEDGDPNGGIRIPNITFEVRTSVGNATGISSDRGLFKMKNVLISEGEVGTQIIEKVEVEAHYTEKDEVKRAIAEVMVDISEQLAFVYGIKQKRKEEETARLSKEEAARRAKEAEAERVRLKREMYEKSEPDRKRQIKEDIEKAGENIINGERFQEAPFNVLREHSDHPNTKRVAMDVAAKSPERTIQGVEIYRSAAWASKVMEIATEGKPLLAIKTIAKYKEMDWAPEILKIAAKRHPHEVVKALSQYCEYEWCKDLIMHIAETEPQAAFEEVKMWEFYPWAEEAATTAANKNPAFAINNFPAYQDQPWAQRVYESVVGSGGFVSAEKAEAQRLLKKKITETGTRLLTKPTGEDFAILYEHRFHPHSKLMITRVAKGSSDACIKAVKIYKSAPWAKEMILLATTKSPGTAINELDQYIEMEWAVDVMHKAASLKPKEAIQALPKYARCPWSKLVIASIAASSPESIFEGMEFIEYQNWAREVALEAAASDPDAVTKFHADYQDQPWAGEVLDFARQEKVRKDEAAEDAKEFNRQEKLIMEIQSRIIGLIDSDPTRNGGGLSREFEKLATFQSHPLSKAVAIDVARNNPDVIFWLNHRLKGASWFLDVIGTAANQYLQADETKKFLFEKSVLGSHIFHETMQMYKTEEWAEKLVLLAAEWSPSSASVNLKYYVDQPWAEKVLLLLQEMELSADYPPGSFSDRTRGAVVFTSVDVYRDQPWAERFMERAKKANPATAAKYSACVYYRFEARRDSIESVFARARQEPKVAIRFCSECKDDPWADAVIKVAEQSIAEAHSAKLPKSTSVDEKPTGLGNDGPSRKALAKSEKDEGKPQEPRPGFAFVAWVRRLFRED